MSNSTKLILFVLALIALLAILIIFLLKPGASKSDATANMNSKQESIQEQSDDLASSTKDSKSISDEWVWPEGEQAKTLTAADMRELQFGDKPYSLYSVYAALESVRIDENGDLILDNNTMLALNEALERYYNQIDAQSLREIEQLIKDALPGKLGEQTAQLVRDYHGFLGAQAEFNQIHQYQSGPQNLSELQRDRSLYNELQSLREAHLGTDTAQRLFSEVNAGAQFMFDMMSLDMDTSLSEEQRAQRRAQIQAEFERSSGKE